MTAQQPLTPDVVDAIETAETERNTDDDALRIVAEAIRDRLPVAGAATEATVAAILAKLIAAPSTEAKQDAAIALLTAIAIDSVNATVTTMTYFSTADARNGLYQTYTETRDSDGLSRTITATRDTATGSITSQSVGAWA